MSSSPPPSPYSHLINFTRVHPALYVIEFFGFYLYHYSEVLLSFHSLPQRGQVGDQNMSPQLYHFGKGIIVLKAFEIQQIQKEAFLELPLSDYKQKFLGNEDCHQFPFLGKFYGHEKGITAQTNFTSLVSPTYLCHPWEPKTCLSCHFSTNVLSFVKMLCKSKF